MRADDARGASDSIQGIEATREKVRNRRSCERDAGIASSIRPVVDEGGDVLVTRELKHPTHTQQAPRFIAAVSGPAMRIRIIHREIVTTTRMGAHTGERRLRDHQLHILACPVLIPCTEEIVLSFAQQMLFRRGGWT